MFEWFVDPYTRLLAGGYFLALNPASCSAVDVLRAFTIFFAGLVLVRMRVHCALSSELRGRYSIYCEKANPALYGTYARAARKVGVRSLPNLYRFADEQPAAFTIGFFRPAIFLAPRLVSSLPAEELEVVLAHELVHVRRFDNLRMWVAGLVPTAGLLFILQALALDAAFNTPFQFGLAHAVALVAATASILVVLRRTTWRRVLFLRELSCDDQTVDILRDPLLIAASLASTWRLQRKMAPHRWQFSWAYASPFILAERGLEYRLRRLLEYKAPSLSMRMRRRAIRIAAGMAVVWLMVFLWSFHVGP